MRAVAYLKTKDGKTVNLSRVRWSPVSDTGRLQLRVYLTRARVSPLASTDGFTYCYRFYLGEGNWSQGFTSRKEAMDVSAAGTGLLSIKLGDSSEFGLSSNH